MDIEFDRIGFIVEGEMKGWYRGEMSNRTETYAKAETLAV